MRLKEDFSGLKMGLGYIAIGFDWFRWVITLFQWVSMG